MRRLAHVGVGDVALCLQGCDFFGRQLVVLAGLKRLRTAEEYDGQKQEIRDHDRGPQQCPTRIRSGFVWRLLTNPKRMRGPVRSAAVRTPAVEHVRNGSTWMRRWR